MRKNIPLLAIVVLTLTACASGGPPTPTWNLTAPEAEMQPCPALAQPRSGQTQDLLADHVATAQAYHLCREHHQGLIHWIRATNP